MSNKIIDERTFTHKRIINMENWKWWLDEAIFTCITTHQLDKHILVLFVGNIRDRNGTDAISTKTYSSHYNQVWTLFQKFIIAIYSNLCWQVDPYRYRCYTYDFPEHCYLIKFHFDWWDYTVICPIMSFWPQYLWEKKLNSFVQHTDTTKGSSSSWISVW